MKHFIALRLAALTCMIALAGCSGDNRPTCYPVRGQVKRGDQPIGEAMIVFHPLVEPSLPVPKPTALTDARGKFSLTTFRENDGAPAGDYAITIELRAQRQVGEELVRDGKNLLPLKYARAGTSGLSFRVVEGPNEVPTLVLSVR